MTKQPEALWMADRLDLYAAGDDHQRDTEQASAELRRLYELNQELLRALKDLLDDADDCGCPDNDKFCPLVGAREAIAKATGEQA